MQTTPSKQQPAGLDDIDAYLDAYTPTGLTPPQWAAVSRPAAALAKAAGEPTLRRVEADIKTLADVVRHLVERGRPLTLAEVLADTTLLDYDLALERRGSAVGSRENARGRLRRMQAAHRGLPWRRERRADGERVTALAPTSLVGELDRVSAAAVGSPEPTGQAFLAAVTGARLARRGDAAAVLDEATWTSARQFAAAHGLRLTRRHLAAAVTHEVFGEPRPLALLHARCAFTRADLDHGLVHAAQLPATPSPAHRRMLRGCGSNGC